MNVLFLLFMVLYSEFAFSSPCGDQNINWILSSFEGQKHLTPKLVDYAAQKVKANRHLFLRNSSSQSRILDPNQIDELADRFFEIIRSLDLELTRVNFSYLANYDPKHPTLPPIRGQQEAMKQLNQLKSEYQKIQENAEPYTFNNHSYYYFQIRLLWKVIEDAVFPHSKKKFDKFRLERLLKE